MTTPELALAAIAWDEMRARAEAAESRVRELEAKQRSRLSDADRTAAIAASVAGSRADEAEAFCALYRRALDSIANPPDGVYSTDWQTQCARKILSNPDAAAEKLLARLRAAEELYSAAHDLSRAAKDIEDEENQHYRLNKACAAYADACYESKPLSLETPPPPQSRP